MKLTLIQCDVCHQDVKQNLQNLKTALKNYAQGENEIGQIILLPELFSTGFIFDDASIIHSLSEDFDHSFTIKELTKLAKKYQTTFVAGIAEKQNDQYFNCVAVINEFGLIHQYQKISQTNIDKQYFSRGNKPVTFELAGIKFGIAVCFDLWFPEIIRQYANLKIDVLLHPANFGSNQSLQIAKARAIENSMIIATCNRIGEDKTKDLTGHYCGNSQICLPTGENLIEFDDQIDIQTVELRDVIQKDKKVIGVDLLDEMELINQALTKS